MKYYLKSRLLLMGLTSLLLLTTITSSIVFASSGNWSEVTRFDGSGNDIHTTDYFTCEHVEWRIRWEYVPISEVANLSSLSVVTYPQGEDIIYIDFIMKIGAEDTNGISYIHDNNGTFYMKIDVGATESYTIIVEQDLDSIPEFPSWIILPIFVTATLFALIIKKRLFHPHS